MIVNYFKIKFYSPFFLFLGTDSTTILYERPDEETASVLLRLSLGKTVTLEELDKIIMYLVRLKYLCFGGGSDATEPQKEEFQSNSLGRSLGKK